jgi:predicted enzyme related to lactoylglutathione lyase
MPPSHFLGLRTSLVTVPDLEHAKRWYAAAFGLEPYFDEPFYVGFDVGGFELGLDPDTSKASPGLGGTVTYWGVRDADAAWAHLLAIGATAHDPVHEVGGGIRVATVLDPFGNPLGLIENPHFKG